MTTLGWFLLPSRQQVVAARACASPHRGPSHCHGCCRALLHQQNPQSRYLQSQSQQGELATPSASTSAASLAAGSGKPSFTLPCIGAAMHLSPALLLFMVPAYLSNTPGWLPNLLTSTCVTPHIAKRYAAYHFYLSKITRACLRACLPAMSVGCS